MFLEKTGISTHAIPGLRAEPAGSRVASHCSSHAWAAGNGRRGGRPPGGTGAGLTYTVHQPHAAPDSGAPARLAGTLHGAGRRLPLRFTSLPSYAAALLPDAVCGYNRYGATTVACSESELSRRPSFQPSPQLPNIRTPWPPSRRPDLQAAAVACGQACMLWQCGKAKATCTAPRKKGLRHSPMTSRAFSSLELDFGLL